MSKEKKVKKTSEYQQEQAFKRYRYFLISVKRMALVIFIVSFAWISIDGYHRLVSQQIVGESAHLIKPFSASLKAEILEKIRVKKYFTISEVEKRFESTKESAELLSEEIDKEASPSGQNEQEENNFETPGN